MAYATSQEVAYIVRTLFPNVTPPSDFSGTTQPSKTEVDLWLDLSAAEIDFNFSFLGYKLPLKNVGGSALDTTQANFLKLLNILGTGSYIKETMIPIPVVAGRTSRANVFAERYNNFLELIKNTDGLGMRMDAFVGTRAYNKQANVRGPLTDFGEDKTDVRDYLMLGSLSMITARLNIREADIRLWSLGDLITWGNISGTRA